MVVSFKRGIAAFVAMSALFPLNADVISETTTFDWGFSNVVQTAEGKTEYVLAYTNTTQTHTFTVPEGVFSFEYLVVAGGGGGGGYTGGGGGAGGLLASSEPTGIAPGSVLTITVGAGGAGGTSGAESWQGGYRGSNGSNSSIVYGETSIEAIGGGAGGAVSGTSGYRNGRSGGSGGGASGSQRYQKDSVNAANGGIATAGQGHNGGSRSSNSSGTYGCSGGGAGGAGAHNAAGGVGIASSITGTEVYYAGGGGRGAHSGYASKDGGLGGGGRGGGNNANATAGTASTGGGGGGGYYLKAGGAGGSGIVVIRYAVADVSSGIVISSAPAQYGSPSPSYGGYDEIPDECVCSEYVDLDEGVRVYCTGWKLYNSAGQEMMSSSALTANLDSSAAGGTLEWQWEFRYALTLSSNEDGSVDESCEGYYGPGTNVTITATANTDCSFDKWIIDGEASDDRTNPLIVAFADAPMSVEALFMAHGVTVNYGDVAELGEDYNETKNYTSNTVDTAYTFTCPKYVVIEENAHRKCCIGYTLAFLPDGEEIEHEVTDAGDSATATVTYSAPVRLTWKWVDEYLVTTSAIGRGSFVEDKSGWYRTGDTISDIEVASAENFLGWGGFGTASSRSGTSASITVAKAPVTVTAYFTATDKDNLVLNGDFEMNPGSIGSSGVITDIDKGLVAGTWRVKTRNDIWGCETGLLIENGQVSLQMSKQKNNSANTTVSCNVNVPCGGIYEFSYKSRVQAKTIIIRDYTWINHIRLIGSNGEIHVADVQHIYYNTTEKTTTVPVELSRGGKYELEFSIPQDGITSPSGDTVNGAYMSFDNVSFKLVSRPGFSIIVR